jgi:sulfate adenylyltransferase subunit 2
MNWRSTHARLRRLEAEAIYILRETVSEFRNPVMLYSIGKDSSAMLHLALKAFHPSKLPFPLLHVDTTWKFREMISFRDATVARLGLELLVHVNEDGVKRGISPGEFRIGYPHPGDEDRRAAPSSGQGAFRRGLRRRTAR